MGTKIEWVINPDGTPGEVWNPVSGCTKVSLGCTNCYAEKIAKRWPVSHAGTELCARCEGTGTIPVTGLMDREPCAQCLSVGRVPIPFSRVVTHPDRLDKPLRWRKPRRVFVCSMGDLGHPDVEDEFLRRVWDVMQAATKHTFYVLTKRPERLRDFIRDYMQWESPERTTGVDVLSNVWLGVSVESADYLHRIDVLREIPAALRFVSAEPLLGPLPDDVVARYPEVGWWIAGSEAINGRPGRDSEIAWFESLRDQCVDAGVAFFCKQVIWHGGDGLRRLVKMPYLGPEQPGRQWAEMPEVRHE